MKVNIDLNSTVWIKQKNRIIHSKLICSYLCSIEQNNKTFLKNNNEWLIFMIEVDLCQSEKKLFLGYQVAESQVVR